MNDKPLVFESHKFTLNCESSDLRNKNNVFSNNQENFLKNSNSFKRDTFETPGMVEFKDSFNCTNLNLTNDYTENKSNLFNL